MTRKTSETADHQETLKVEPFKIKWPEKLQIEPLYQVQVTAKREAWVYPDVTWQAVGRAGDPDGNGLREVHGFRVVFVIAKTGLPPASSDNYYGREIGVFCDSLLDVRLAIQDYSQRNQPKVRTVNQKVQTIVNGDESDDD